MPKVKNIEKRIHEKEGFEVRIFKDGKDVRGDRNLPVRYQAERKSKDNMTVNDWKKGRFYTQYPGYDVNVLDANGKVVSGQTMLRTVRDSYDE